MRGQTYTLGVLLADLRDPFFADIMTSVNEALVRTQYQPSLGVGQSAPATERALVDAMVDRQMDVVILAAPRIATAELERSGAHLPTTIIGHPSPRSGELRYRQQ